MKRSRLKSDPDKARAWQRRSRKKLRQKKRLRSKKPVRPYNAERMHRRRHDAMSGEKHTYGPYYEWTKTLRCVATGVTPAGAAHHHPTVGSGAKDYGCCLPVTPEVHRKFHAPGGGVEFVEKKYGINVEAELERVRKAWDRRKAGTKKALEVDAETASSEELKTAERILEEPQTENETLHDEQQEEG